MFFSRTRVNEKFYLLGYNALQSVEIQPTFRRNMSPPSKQETSVIAGGNRAGFLLGLFLDPEDGVEMFLRNVG
jgi:hypothetical protein